MNKKTMIILGIAIVAVLAVVIAFMFGTKSNEIELTLDNYTDYLKITSYESKSGELIKVKKPFWLGRYSGGRKQVHDEFFTELIWGISSKSVAPNFNYSNVKVTAKFTGTILTVDRNSDPDNPTKVELPFELEGTFSLTTGGTSKDETITHNLGNYMVPGGAAAYWEFEPNFTFEIIDISGTVTPA